MQRKNYIVSLDFVAPASVEESELVERLGLDESLLTSREVDSGVLWRYEPETDEQASLDDRIRLLASLVHVENPDEIPSGIRIYLSIGVLYYDTVTCTTVLSSECLGALVTKLGRSVDVEIVCYPCSGAGS